MVQRPLSIGIDARAATEEPAGRGRVVRELLRALARRDEPHRYRLYAREVWREPLDERFRWHAIDAGEPWWNLRAARAASGSCDVFLSTNSYLSIFFLSIPGAPIVHDLVTFDRRMRPSWRSALIERLTLGLAVRRAEAILAVSEATATALTARFPRASGRVVVSQLAAAPHLASSDARQRSSLAPGFVLAVGTIEPRKNLPGLIAAYRLLPDELQERHPLVVAGKIGWDTEEALAAMATLGERCRYVGLVPDRELSRLYRDCGVFCFPSLSEGFGLPVVEAMTFGKPVITSDRPSLREIGSDAVLYVDPLDPATIAAAIRGVLEEPAAFEALAERGRRRAAGFDWDRTAAITLETLERIAR